MRILALVLLALLAFTPAQAQRSDWARPFEAHRVIGNLYYVGTYDLAVYLVASDEGHFLINTGMEDSTAQIRSGVESLGFQLEDVKVLLTMQAHWDHTAALAEIKRLTGAEMWATADDTPVLEDGGFSDPHFGGKQTFKPVEVERILRDGETISLGDAKLKVVETPGHTRGCTTWSTQLNDGDSSYNVVFVGSPNVLPEMKLLNNESYPDIVTDFRLGFDRMAALPCDIMLGAHGSYFVLEEKIEVLKSNPTTNPFIEPDRYAKFVERKRQIFEERLAEDLEETSTEE